jgi:hypothetical protein
MPFGWGAMLVPISEPGDFPVPSKTGIPKLKEEY